MNKIYRYLSVLAVVAGISLVIYFFVRIYFFAATTYRFWDWIFGILLIASETFMIVHSFGYIVGAVRLKTKKRQYRLKKLDPENLPSVAVAVAAKHEPKAVLEQTLITLNSLDYANKRLYLLDGSTDGYFLETDRELAEKYGAVFFHPAEAHGAKAGIINDFLCQTDAEYVAVFDADQNPMPDFLQKVVAIAERDKKIAFVQTPQFYSNLATSPVAKGSQMQQSVFFESICESKDRINAMFCCGTNVLFRRRALQAVGGFDESSVTEDFATSVKLHMLGYRSAYYNHVRVFGMAPESLPAYFRQQARWAAGNSTVFLRLLKNLIRRSGSLTLGQWWEYFLSSTHYFSGWAFFFLMMGPIAFLMFRVPSFFMDPQVYLAIFIPYFFMTLGNFYATMKKRHYGFSDVYAGVVLGSLSFPVLMKATLKGFWGKKLVFQITPKGQVARLAFWELWPWTLMLVLNLSAIGFGIWRFGESPYAIGINLFWCVYHSFILLQIFKFNALPSFPEDPEREPNN